MAQRCRNVRSDPPANTNIPRHSYAINSSNHERKVGLTTKLKSIIIAQHDNSWMFHIDSGRRCVFVLLLLYPALYYSLQHYNINIRSSASVAYSDRVEYVAPHVPSAPGFCPPCPDPYYCCSGWIQPWKWKPVGEPERRQKQHTPTKHEATPTLKQNKSPGPQWHSHLTKQVQLF